MILIGILLWRLSQCSQLPPKVVSFYTVCKFECFSVTQIFREIFSSKPILESLETVKITFFEALKRPNLISS